MYYGLQLAHSGILTGMYRTDVLANNLTNAATVGYKPDAPFAMARDAARNEDGLFALPSNRMLEKLGAGATLAPNATNFRQGALEQTGNALDLAIQGDGFFVLRDVSDGNDDAIRFTRDGRFTLDSRRRLVSANLGLPVLGPGNRQITLPGDGPVTVDERGEVSQDGRVVGRLDIVDVPNGEQLTRTEGALFVPSATAYQNRFTASGRVRQGHLEQSGASGINAMLQFQKATKSVNGNVRIAKHHDELMNAAINRFGRVS